MQRLHLHVTLDVMQMPLDPLKSGIGEKTQALSLGGVPLNDLLRKNFLRIRNFFKSQTLAQEEVESETRHRDVINQVNNNRET